MDTQRLLENDLTSATALNLICLDNFTAEYYNWDPEMVRLELRKLSTEIPEVNLDKIQAVSTLLTTELFYTYWEPFSMICRVFYNDSSLLDIAIPLDKTQILWGITEAKINDGDESFFSTEVEGYIENCIRYYGDDKDPSEYITNRLSRIKKEIKDTR